MTDAEKALREAHEACPCRHGGRCESAILCRCYGTVNGGINDSVKCFWPQHAAIDRAVREAYLEGDEDGQQRAVSHESFVEPPWLPKDGK